MVTSSDPSTGHGVNMGQKHGKKRRSKTTTTTTTTTSTSTTTTSPPLPSQRSQDLAQETSDGPEHQDGPLAPSPRQVTTPSGQPSARKQAPMTAGDHQQGIMARDNEIQVKSVSGGSSFKMIEQHVYHEPVHHHHYEKSPSSQTAESGPGSGDQGQGSAPGRRPGSLSLPAESRELRNLIDNTRQMIATACPQGYVETAALSELLEGLQQQGACLVLGLPGHGMTTLALQGMGRLAASHNLKPLRLERPEQWGWIPGEQNGYVGADSHVGQQRQQQQQQLQQRQEQSQRQPSCTLEVKGDAAQNKRHYVVLVDDVFGKGNYNEIRRDAWAGIFDLILAKVRSGQVKLILASRLHIYQACEKYVSDHRLFSEARLIDLSKPKYWTDEDKEDVLQHFLLQHHVLLTTSVEEIVKASRECTEIGFPQCCLYFVTNSKAWNEGPGFFRHPVRFLKNQLDQLQRLDAKSYFVLVLTLLGGGLLPPETTASENLSLLALSRQCGLREPMTDPEIEATARHLRGVYLRKQTVEEEEEGVFGFIHQSLQDCLVVAVCKTDLKRALEVCSMQQLCEYVHTESRSADHAELIHIVRSDKWPLLADRLVKAMTSEEFSEALKHSSLKKREFVSVFVAKLHERSHVSQLLEQTHDMRRLFNDFPDMCELDTKSAVAALIAQSVPELPALLLQSEEMAELSQEDRRTHLEEALISACFVGDAALFSLLLDREAPVSVQTLIAACSSEKEDVSILRAVRQRLLEQELGLRVYRDLLWICSWKDKVESLQYLLEEARSHDSQEKLDEVFTDLILKSHSSENRKVPARFREILSALKAAGAKLSTSRIDLWTAAGHPDSFALEELLSENVSTEQLFNEKKQSLLHESARWGSLQCLQVLLESPRTSSLDIDALDAEKRSPLHVAADCGHLEVAQFLLQQGADPDGGICFSNIDVISSGESRGNDGSRNVTNSGSRDSQVVCEGTTPLHLACLRHHLSLVGLLIGRNARTDVLDERRRAPLHEYASRGPTSDLRERESAEESTRQRVERLLVKKIRNINQQDGNGATALHLAAGSGLLSLTETLLSHKAGTDIVDDRQRTALHASASSSYRGGEDKARKRVMELLVARTVNILHRDEDGLTPLHVAAETDNLTMLEVLLERGVRADSVDRHKRSVLHAYLDRPCCCNVRMNKQRRRLEEMMLDTVAELDSPDAEERTALHLAARCTHVSLIEKLLQRQARVDVTDKEERTPLHWYAASRRQDKQQSERERELTQRAEELLVSTAAAAEAGLDTQDGSGQTVLHVAASNFHLTLIKTLIEHGARVDILDKRGRTPIHRLDESSRMTISDIEQCLEVVSVMVEKMPVEGEIDINTGDKRGHSPLHLACERNELDLVEVLLEHRARVDVLDKRGQTPLHLVCKRNETRLVEVLLRRGARVDVLDEDRRTPLHCYAEAHGWHSSFLDDAPVPGVEALLVKKMPAEGEVDINTQDLDGKTVLHLAATHHNLSLLELLMRRGARTDLLDREGMSALHCYAASRPRLFMSDRDESMARRLVESSPHVGVRAFCGCTPLDMARQKQNFFLVKLLEVKTGTSPDDTISVCPHVASPRLAKTKEESPDDVTAGADTPARNLEGIQVTCHRCWKSTYRPRGRRSDH